MTLEELRAERDRVYKAGSALMKEWYELNLDSYVSRIHKLRDTYDQLTDEINAMEAHGKGLKEG